MESHRTGFPPFPPLFEIPSGFQHSQPLRLRDSYSRLNTSKPQLCTRTDEQNKLVKARHNVLVFTRHNILVFAQHNELVMARNKMAKPNEKLASSLAALHDLQQEGQHIVRTGELSRVHRDCLVKSGFLQPVIKGWLMSASPSARPGDSTAWFASFWEFCAAYCTQRFGANWHLSPEQSLLLHAENTVVPTQTIVYSRKGHNNTTRLPFIRPSTI